MGAVRYLCSRCDIDWSYLLVKCIPLQRCHLFSQSVVLYDEFFHLSHKSTSKRLSFKKKKKCWKNSVFVWKCEGRRREKWSVLTMFVSDLKRSRGLLASFISKEFWASLAGEVCASCGSASSKMGSVSRIVSDTSKRPIRMLPELPSACVTSVTRNFRVASAVTGGITPPIGRLFWEVRPPFSRCSASAESITSMRLLSAGELLAAGVFVFVVAAAETFSVFLTYIDARRTSF